MPQPAPLPAPPLDGAPVNAAFASDETLRLLALRRSTKIAHLAAPGPTDAQIGDLLRLAARVPDHGKLAPWRFLVIAGEARARAGAKLAALVADDAGVDESRLELERARFLRAPVCVAVVSRAAPHPKIPEWEQVLSAGAACYGLVIAAHAMGFAGCWLTEWPCYDERARAALGLEPHERIAGFVYLGAAQEPATERTRVDAAAVTTWL